MGQTPHREQYHFSIKINLQFDNNVYDYSFTNFGCYLDPFTIEISYHKREFSFVLSIMGEHDGASSERKHVSKSKKKEVRIEEVPVEPEDIHPLPDPAQAEKRKRVVRELLETERAHVGSLDTAITHYCIPLTASNILPPNTVRAIFSNLEVIRQWNQTFLEFLEAELECGDQTLGSVFLQMVSIVMIPWIQRVWRKEGIF